MKKIAIFFPKDSEALFNRHSNNSFGGASTQLYNIAKELSNHNGFKTYSLINNYSTIDFIDRDKFYFVKTFKSNHNFLQKILVFHRELKKLKPDILIQRGLTIFSCLLALYCKIFKIKLIFMFAHDREVQGCYQKNNNKCPLFFMLLKFSEELIVQSGYQKKILYDRYNKKSIIIKSSYNIEKVRKISKEYILWVSRLMPWKRPELFLELAHYFPEEKFVMIAPGIKGNEEYTKEIYKKTEKIENIKIMPFVQFLEIDKYFQKAKIFVNTSESEGFPNTFIQAAKNSAPIISLSVNPDNFIEEYKCGYYCHDDIDKMKKNLRKVIDNSKIHHSLSSGAYKYVKENHDIKKNIKKFISIL